MAQTYRKIEAVRKAAEILDYVANAKDTVTGVDVAKAVNLPVGTVMCHLITLEDAGILMRIGGDGWTLGMKLALYWARVKSRLESGIARQQKDLETITIEGDK